MKRYFAPMEGITGWGYRRIYEEYYGHIHKYFTPFLSPCQDRCFTHREMQEILPEHNEGIHVVPQLLTCRSGDFIWAAKELKAMGYDEVNLNLGCPSGTVVSKGKGSGFLAHPGELNEFLEQVFDGLDLKISVKTRIGKTDPGEFEQLMEIYNRYPLSELIIHPRVQKEFYKGIPHRDVFAHAFQVSKNPVCYNGDLFTVSDFHQFRQAFPEVETVMLGRGLIANPALALQLAERDAVGKGRKDGGTRAVRYDPKQEKIRLLDFHDALYHHYQETMPGERPTLFKMKELWSYMIFLFRDGEKCGKKIRKAQNFREYEAAVHTLFAEKEMAPDTEFRGW